MNNIVRIVLREEKDYVVKDNEIKFEKESIGYNVYACTNDIECWIGSCMDIDSLEEIVSEEELVSSIQESCSENEIENLMSVLENNAYKYDFFGQIRTAMMIR